ISTDQRPLGKSSFFLPPERERLLPFSSFLSVWGGEDGISGPIIFSTDFRMRLLPSFKGCVGVGLGTSGVVSFGDKGSFKGALFPSELLFPGENVLDGISFLALRRLFLLIPFFVAKRRGADGEEG